MTDTLFCLIAFVALVCGNRIVKPLPCDELATASDELTVELELVAPLPAWLLFTLEEANSVFNFDIPPTPLSWPRFLGCVDAATCAANDERLSSRFASSKRGTPPLLHASARDDSSSSIKLRFTLPTPLVKAHAYELSVRALNASVEADIGTPTMRAVFRVAPTPNAAQLATHCKNSHGSWCGLIVSIESVSHMEAKRTSLLADFQRRADRRARVMRAYKPLDASLLEFKCVCVFFALDSTLLNLR